MAVLTAGLDLDEERNPSAIAVVETEKRRDERGNEDVYGQIWFLERLSKQPDDAMRRMGEIVDEAMRRTGKAPKLYVNVTAAGEPGFRALSFGMATPPRTRVYLIPSDRPPPGNVVTIGKDQLISGLNKLLRSGAFRVLETAEVEAEQLRQKLLGHRPGDEPGPLMIALGLAVQQESRPIGRGGGTGRVTVGLDMDERRQPAAIAVVERERCKWENGKEELCHTVTDLHRLSELSYDEAMHRVVEIINDKNEDGRLKMYVNVTGLGTQVLVVLRDKGVGARPVAVFLTPGARREVRDKEVWLGRGGLVSGVWALLQMGRLRVLGTEGAEELKEELLSCQGGDDALGPLVTALGLAVQEEDRRGGRVHRVRKI